ncbi:MAG: hypothetical protein ACRCUJ_12790 [Phocaeicola sp.]
MSIKKSEKQLFAIIGMSDKELDRRDQLLELKAKRDADKNLVKRMRSNWESLYRAI